MRKRIGLYLALAISLAVPPCGISAQSPPPAKPAAATAITREKLEARLAELQKGREQAIANVNAFDGAMQETQHWLDELEAAETQAKAEDKKQGKKAKEESKKPAKEQQ